MSIMGGHGQELDYESWACFYQCEEALRTGRCTEQDIKYCFQLADEAGTGRIGLHVVTPFYEDMVSSGLHKK